MPSQKITSQFGFFEVEDIGSPGVYRRVGGVSSIRDVRSGTAAEIDVSDLSSTAKEFVLGLADNGSMSIDLFYDPADPGQVILETLRETSAVNGFRVGIRNPLGTGSPTGYVLLEFDGLVQTFPVSLAVDAVVTGTVTVRITGAITKVG
jgi:hypothetical protein